LASPKSYLKIFFKIGKLSFDRAGKKNFGCQDNEEKPTASTQNSRE
jgi:hypothetical protein